ncbi:DMT family transporter [Luteimonas sp. BDR2-5]|uniref:DMT family transporter n=1 Tax=Proluteimonas luteida TaxID=2878685 RepID=UPI001E35A747|nr:DMT family transporter [Luteimonas sp. BDR2-5]MCD9029799.1 DMT family transporter [Luteimonas sp. BDR2-5]
MSRSATSRNDARAAALWMLFAVLAFAGMDAGMKWIANDYSAFQVATFRSLATLPLVLAWIALRGRAGSLLHVHWPLHLLRGLLGVGMIAGFVYGLARMPLSTAYAIVFVSPLMVTALAVPLLGEKVGPRRWTAIALGVVGVLVVLRPTGEGVATLAGLAVVGGALCYAVASITVRKLAQRDSPEALVFWFLVLMALFAGALAWPDWQPLQRGHWWVLGLIGVTGALGQVGLTHAFRLGEASQVAPLEYTALVWVVLLDLVVWQVLPDGMTWLGAAIIVASGLYMFRRERVLAKGGAPVDGEVKRLDRTPPP